MFAPKWISAALTAVFLAFPAASSAAVAKPATNKPSGTRTFKVGSMTFSGKPKIVCVIEGKWSDSEPFRFDAWDECSQMQISRGTQADYQSVRPRGTDKRFAGTDIPSGSEVFVISNNYSTVLVFRDKHGIDREILIRD